MPQDNQLEALLKRAKKVCDNKHNQVASSLDESPPTKFKDIGDEQDTLFITVIQSTAFDAEIPAIDQLELATQIKAVDVLDPSQFNEYITLMNSFLLYLKEKVCPYLPKKEVDNQTSDWNLKTLDALRGMRRKVTGRQRFFKNNGKNIADDPIYQQHKIVRKDYREKLKNNTIQSLRTDEMVLHKFRDDITEITVLTSFIDMLSKTNTFMEEKVQEEIIAPPIV